MPLGAHEQRFIDFLEARRGYVIGVDEVGYGAWAGPVAVCAAVAPIPWSNPEVRDSKKLSPEVRRLLVEKVLLPSAIPFYSIELHDSVAIDRMGVAKARDELVLRAVKACVDYGYGDAWVVMDGNLLPTGLPANSICFPKADDLVPAVSAASVFAKVWRDDMMHSYGTIYPGYDFKHNVGYGTPKHFEGLTRLGACPIHRVSYRNMRQFKQQKLPF